MSIMPIRCTFSLNKQPTSTLYCPGFGSVEAYSGLRDGRDNPDAVALPNVGPLPPGTYYLIDRQSGGRLGWARDWWNSHMWGSTDHSRWFTLWNARGGDMTHVGRIQRGHFRLHPEGMMRMSEGCITVVSPAQFDALRTFIRSRPADMPVPGTPLRAYGTVEVR